MQVSSPLPAWFFNTFDFPIRLLYNRAGPLSWLLQKVLFARFKASQPESLDRVFSDMMSICENEGVCFERARVLELGPGNSRLNAIRFLLDGVDHVTLVDKFPRALSGSRQEEFFRSELRYIRKAHGIEQIPFIEDGRIDPSRTATIDADIRSVELRDIDFLYSVDVFEHIREYPSVIEKMFEMVRPGGHIYHVIDMRDHYNFARPFLFYKYSNRVWDLYLTREGFSYWNRARYGEFIACFRQAGFELVYEQLTRLPMPEKKVHEVFSGRDDLDIAQATLLLRRPS